MTNELVCVCRFGIYFTYVIESIESKLISVCLINDYSLIAQLDIFVYERAELFFILLECSKVKLSILNNFKPFCLFIEFVIQNQLITVKLLRIYFLYFRPIDSEVLSQLI